MTQWIRNVAILALIALFIGPGLGFAVNMMRATSGISDTENRRLADIPSFQGDLRQYAQDFDIYLEDHFGFRMNLIRLAREVRDNLGENPPNVVFGRDNWLFIGNTDYRDEFEGNGPWTSAQVEQWIDDLSSVKQALALENIPFAAIVAVDKARLYPEKLPLDWRQGSRRFRTVLHAHPEASDAGLIDAAPIVRAAKARGVKVFYTRDTHWTLDGTYDLALSIMDQLDPDRSRPRFDPGPRQVRVGSRLLDLEGLAGYSQTQEPNVPMMQGPPSVPGYVQHRQPPSDEVQQRGEFATWEIKGAPGVPAGRLVIVGDSFGDALIEHFRASYAEIIRLHHGAHVFDVTLSEILAEQPDAVLFVTAERQAIKKQRPIRPE
jgi:hypothetical protein